MLARCYRTLRTYALPFDQMPFGKWSTAFFRRVGSLFPSLFSSLPFIAAPFVLHRTVRVQSQGFAFEFEWQATMSVAQGQLQWQYPDDTILAPPYIESDTDKSGATTKRYIACKLQAATCSEGLTARRFPCRSRNDDQTRFALQLAFIFVQLNGSTWPCNDGSTKGEDNKLIRQGNYSIKSDCGWTGQSGSIRGVYFRFWIDSVPISKEEVFPNVADDRIGVLRDFGST